MNRRTLLTTLALAPLAACGTLTPSTVATDATTIVNGLAAIEPTIVGLAGIPAATAAKIAADLALAQSLLPSLSGIVASFSTPTTALQTIVTAVNDILGLATTAPLAALIPANVETILQAAAALLPVVEAAAGLSSASATAPTMTPDAARVVLKAAVGK